MQVELMEYSSNQCTHIKSHQNKLNTSYAGPIGHVEVESILYRRNHTYSPMTRRVQVKSFIYRSDRTITGGDLSLLYLLDGGPIGHVEVESVVYR